MDPNCGRRFFIIDEERLRELIMDFSPEIRHDTALVADLIRDLVKTEREKAGLDRPRGMIELYKNSQKTGNDPDLIGSGRIAGRFYRAAGWFGKTDKLKIALLPRKAK